MAGFVRDVAPRTEALALVSRALNFLCKVREKEFPFDEAPDNKPTRDLCSVAHLSVMHQKPARGLRGKEFQRCYCRRQRLDLSAAATLELDLIPRAKVSCELVILEEYIELPGITTLLASPDYAGRRGKVKKTRGYR